MCVRRDGSIDLRDIYGAVQCIHGTPMDIRSREGKIVADPGGSADEWNIRATVRNLEKIHCRDRQFGKHSGIDPFAECSVGCLRTSSGSE